MDIAVFVLSLLPGVAWLFFYLQEDLHPEPRSLLSLVFFAGMVSALAALFLQTAANGSLDGLGVAVFSPVSLIVLALIEEFCKFAAAWLVIRKNPEFDEPVDAMIYMIVAALGFATLENVGALLGKAPHLADFGFAVQTTSLRFVGATLLHTLTSGLVGYYWATDIRRFYSSRFIAMGLLLATILHAAFNYLIISYGELSYALLFVVVVGFFILSDFEKLRDKMV